ncbi:MAG: helicase-related protein [Hyphomicrobiaceae bacterium]
MSVESSVRGRNVTAVLGPTNTGKTHLAIERMLGHETGLIGLPLRLLAREVYDKIAARVGPAQVALVTGEEKIKPEHPRYFVCTVEAMPREIDVDFLAIDEVQLAADPERGHVFTDRLLHARGKLETLLLGAQTMRETIDELTPGAHFISRPRLSRLTYAGEKKITRLPPRSAVVSFSAQDVYAVAELIRRQRGGAAVVLGALSPRTRNAQVALYQSGDVDFLVATDAIGMGLNLDVDHVAFAAVRKFDGHVHRDLTPAELGQIAGRAGRHMNDGTFGVTGGVPAFTPELVEQLETHAFPAVKTLQWRSRDLDFDTLDRLRDSLRRTPREMRLVRARMADDVTALESVSGDPDVVRLATTRIAVARLWDVCQVPDYRKISPQNHAELAGTLYKFLMGPEERIPEDWFAKQVAFADRTDGDIDTLANRIAHIRTWTFVSNRVDWLKDPAHWQERTRAIEDSLSDALHERLTQRFVDRRTSALMRSLKDKDEMYAEIADDGAVHVEKHYVGRLRGFRFWPETQADGIHGRAMRNAAAHVLAKELAMRVRRVVAAKNDAFKLTRQGAILWRDEEIGRIEAGEDPLRPQVSVVADEHLSGPDKQQVQDRLSAWLKEHIAERLKPLVEIAAAEDISGLARGIAFRLTERYGILRREEAATEIKSLDQAARAQLRKYGVRFGAFNIYFPLLLKPASADAALTLFLLRDGASHGLDVAQPPEAPKAGLTSVVVDKAVPEAFYRTAGFHVCGPRAVRVDILERLADRIRPLIAWRPSADGAAPRPPGATGNGGFTVTPDMMSILGCSAEDLGLVLKALGFWVERRRIPATPPAATSEAPVAAAESTPAEPGADAVVPEIVAPPAVDAEAQEGLPAAPDEPSPTALPDTPTEAPVDGPAAEPAEAGKDEPQFEEIWRPRRRGRPHPAKRPPARRQPAAAPSSDQPQARPDPRREAPDRPQATKEQRREREDARHKPKPQHRHRPDQRRKGGPGRGDREERRPLVHTAAPPRGAAADADSPFAALSSLKAALEKRSQE